MKKEVMGGFMPLHHRRIAWISLKTCLWGGETKGGRSSLSELLEIAETF